MNVEASVTLIGSNTLGSEVCRTSARAEQSSKLLASLVVRRLELSSVSPTQPVSPFSVVSSCAGSLPFGRGCQQYFALLRQAVTSNVAHRVRLIRIVRLRFRALTICCVNRDCNCAKRCRTLCDIDFSARFADGEIDRVIGPAGFDS